MFKFFALGRGSAMNVGEHVVCAIDDYEVGKVNSALLHACIAVDGTSCKLSSGKQDNRKRYVACLRQYYWLLEPMIGAGLNLVETRFTNVPLPNNSSPDLAEIVYEEFRCNHAHGSDHPPGHSLVTSIGTHASHWLLGDGHLHMPDRVVFALLGVAVFSRVNRDQQVPDTYYLSLGSDRFPLNEWWGREDDFRPVADRYNQVRVILKW
jgi:hypothetical protein